MSQASWPRGVYPSPLPFGARCYNDNAQNAARTRGGLILSNEGEEIVKKFNSLVFPGTQGGPLMHVIAAKAVAFKEALSPGFRDYQKQVVENAQTMAATLIERGYPIVSGGTDNHLMLVNLVEKGITGKDADAALGRANITVNKNTVPNDPCSPFVTSGLRLGTPAITTRGFGIDEVRTLTGWIADVLDDISRRRGGTASSHPGLSISAGVSRSTVECMHCPFCGHEETKVIDSRLAGEGRQIRRRRQCLDCNERFTTFESAELVMPRVIKSDNRREPFDEEKVRASMRRALEKRPVSADDVEQGVGRMLHPPSDHWRARSSVPSDRRFGHGRTAQSR